MSNPRLQRPYGGGGPPAPPKMRGGMLMLLFLMAAVIALVWLMRVNIANEPRKITLSEFYERLYAGQVAKVEIEPKSISGELALEEGKRPSFRAEILEQNVEELTKSLVAWNQAAAADPAKGKLVEFKAKQASEWLQLVFSTILPLALLALLFWFLVGRQLRSAGMGGGLLSFGKSQARLASRDRAKVTFNDVAGIEEAKEEVQEIVEFLRSPAKFKRLGGRIPRGVLLVGSPGTGKTLLAKAIAGEADVPFFSISGSDFVEMFVGVGASRVRDLFRQAKENSPCIIFLDEIDAVGRRRGAGLGGGHDEREQTLNAILVEMDGFDREESIIVIAATNRPDVLDPALLRPGRFDRQIMVDLPDIRGREEILKVHARKYKLAPAVNLRELARGTPTFSGADLEAVLNESALLATRKAKDAIEMEDLEEARDKVRWGRQRRSRMLDEADRRITAFHESGHALMGLVLPDIERPHKVTIVPQGHALGMTMALPERDRYVYQKRRLLASIAMLLGGRAAEELYCGDISTGAQNDLERATEIARSMVCRWGMSELLGPISYHEGEDTIFLGREITRTQTHGEAMAVKIDDEIARIMTMQYQLARKTLEEHGSRVQAMAAALLKREALLAADLEKIMAGEDLGVEREPFAAAAEKVARDDAGKPGVDSAAPSDAPK